MERIDCLEGSWRMPRIVYWIRMAIVRIYPSIDAAKLQDPAVGRRGPNRIPGMMDSVRTNEFKIPEAVER